MTIYNYVEGLLPNFQKATIREDLLGLKAELSETTLPPYHGAASVFTKKSPFQSRMMKGYDALIMQKAHNNRYANSILYINEILSKMSAGLPELEKAVDEHFGKDIARDGLTYPKANCLRLIEAMSFIALFSRRYLLLAYALEIPEYHDGRATVPSPFTKAELDWIESNIGSFAALLPVFDRNGREIRNVLGNIPEMVVAEELQGVATAVAGAAKLDPFKFGFIPLPFNPIYHIRMAIADRQVSRYKAAQEEKKALELRLLQMRLAQKGNKDAALEKQIEYTEQRLQTLVHKLQKVENQYG